MGLSRYLLTLGSLYRDTASSPCHNGNWHQSGTILCTDQSRIWQRSSASVGPPPTQAEWSVLLYRNKAAVVCAKAWCETGRKYQPFRVERRPTTATSDTIVDYLPTMPKWTAEITVGNAVKAQDAIPVLPAFLALGGHCTPTRSFSLYPCDHNSVLPQAWKSPRTIIARHRRIADYYTALRKKLNNKAGAGYNNNISAQNVKQ
ncbi:hypothetical protein F5888DRAFT_1891722 [Russula emetica]|nr:hypothetical protein F5888DRAFT_1891722 [Russula emetica]